MPSMVSIVMPLYNKAPYVERAIRSVLAQTYADFELVVVDDGSTDGGASLVSGLADLRIRVLKQVNQGPGAARNRGVQAAQCPLIAFLDADDEWNPRFLESGIGALEAHPGAVAVFSNNQCTHKHAPEIRRRRFPAAVLLSDYYAFWRRHGTAMSSSSTLVRREALLAAGGFPMARRVGEDLDTWFRLAARGSVVFLPEVLSIYHTGLGLCAVEELNFDVWDSFRLLTSEGKMPRALRKSAERLAAHQRLRTVRCRIHARRFREAQGMLLEMPVRQWLSFRWIVFRVTCRFPWLWYGYQFAKRLIARNMRKDR